MDPADTVHLLYREDSDVVTLRFKSFLCAFLSRSKNVELSITKEASVYAQCFIQEFAQLMSVKSSFRMQSKE